MDRSIRLIQQMVINTVWKLLDLEESRDLKEQRDTQNTSW